jgi:hypothetical protein
MPSHLRHLECICLLHPEFVFGGMVHIKIKLSHPLGHGKMHRNTEISQPKNHILLMHLHRNTKKIDMKLDVVRHFRKRETIM